MIESLLIQCHNAIWSTLHAIILDIPPTRLPLFPALAGSVWFLTLASLLLTWIARGMPRYPGQSNPHVAFVHPSGADMEHERGLLIGNLGLFQTLLRLS